ncbi:MAG: sugar ABC transporter ATP-binding protein [Spirochaetales bacterium]|nr:sugar ABC transporter ATP-binding protein [Spirochaetales bacterium]
MKSELLSLEYICTPGKGSPVLQDFSMELFRGEIVGLLTMNSREISSLVEILTGQTAPQSGRISYNNKPLLSSYPGRKSPIIVLGRRSQLIDDFNIAENIFVLRRGFGKYLINRKTLEDQAAAMLEKLGIAFPSTSYVRDLSVLEKLIIQIAKSHILRYPVIVLRELSAFLSDDDLARLLPFLKELASGGQTFLVLDSTSSVVGKVSSRVLLLHKGRNLWNFREGEFSPALLERFFKVDRGSPPSGPDTESPGELVLSLEDGASALQARKGSVLVAIDPEGGRICRMMEFLKGCGAAGDLKLRLRGRIIPQPGPRLLLKKGIALIGEDPLEGQLYPQLSALDNLVFPMGEKVPFFWQRRRFRENVARQYEALFSSDALNCRISALSSTDRLTLAYMRWHVYSPDLVILFRPFSTVDGRLEELIISHMSRLLEKGIGLLILTSNLWELSALKEKLPVQIQRLPPLS